MLLCILGKFMFMDVAGVWQDWIIGLILLFIALFILCTCLVLIVKILASIFKGPIAVILKKFVNADIPGWCCWHNHSLWLLSTFLLSSSRL